MVEAGWDVLMRYGFFIVMLFVCGFYCILVTRNLVRTLIGIEILMKAVTLLLIVAGYVTGSLALAQVIVITLIIIEVVIIVVIAGIILGIYRKTNSLDVKDLKELKG